VVTPDDIVGGVRGIFLGWGDATVRRDPQWLGCLGKVVTNSGIGTARVRGCALASVSVLSLVVMSVAAKAQPTGGSVVAGSAQISASGASTLINQTTSKAIINWQSFSVGQGGSVQFNQPNSSAITLNRVTGTSTSVIDGAIRANGQVWLLNPNGLLFGNGATINVGGLLATTSDIADQDFLGGRYNFSSTGGKGGITNNGSITAGNGGSVVLSAPSVTNKGLIAASAGHVVLGGTDTFTVDFNGDHLLSYAISPNSAGGKVTNAGRIAVAGGTILMTARAAAGVQDAVINNTGMAEATSVRQENGEIILEADNGTVADSGTLDASGKASGQTGGTVKVLGQQVAVADGAKIDVSGDAGGGTALIGGNLHGAGPEPNAQNTTVGKAIINASAITKGNGGTVAVYSTGTTQVAGTITAQGGIISGNGGMVETSGHLLGVDNAAFVSTLAPHGKSGTWLLDPDNLTIIMNEGGNTNQTFGTTGTATVGNGAIRTALSDGNVTLQANVDITVSAAISTTTGNTLELDAGHSIILSAGINLNASGTGQGSTLILSANDPNGDGGFADSSITGTGVLNANHIVLSLAPGMSGGIGSSGSPLHLAYQDANNDALSLIIASGSSVYLTSQASNTQISGPAGITIDSTAAISAVLAAVNVDSNTFSLVSTGGQISQPMGGSITASSVILDTSLVNGAVGSSGTPLVLHGPDINPVDLTVATGTSSASGGSAYIHAAANGSYTGSVNVVSATDVNGSLPGISLGGNLTSSFQGGSLSLKADSDVTVGGSIQTVFQGSSPGASSISLDAGGGIVLNGSITASSTGAGTIVLTANDPILNETGPFTGITGAGLLTAANISLKVEGAGGPIGTSDQSVEIASDTGGTVLLNLATSGGDAYLESVPSGVTLAGVNLNPTTTTGSLTLTASGAITQTGSLNVFDLNLATTSTDGAGITITCGECSSLAGTARFNTQNGNVSFSNLGVTLGSSSVNGNLTVNAEGRQLLIADSLHPNGMVLATGTISLSAQGDIVEGSSYTSGDLSSLVTTYRIPLQPGSAGAETPCGISVVLCVDVMRGDVLLDAPNNVTGSVLIYANNFSTGSETGNISFTNTNGIVLAMGESPQSGGVATMAKFNNGTTPYTLALTSLDGNINIGSLPGGDESGAALAAVSALTLRAGGDIMQDPAGFISMPSGAPFTAVASGNISLSSTTNAISGVITLQSPGTINLVNSVDTTVGSIGDVPDLGGRPQAATSVSIQVLGEGVSLLQDTSAATSLGITAGTISLSTQGGGIGTNGAPILLSGGLDSNGIADAATASFSATTGGGDVYLAALSPLNIANSGISLNGGAMVLIGDNNITVNAPITTTANVIGIDTAGSIQVNAPITAAFDGSTPGVIGLIANDPTYGANSASSGISGSGLLTAGIIDLTAGPGQNGQSGSIGQGTPSQSTAPLQVTSDTDEPLSLAIRTYGGNAYINSAVAVSIDDQTTVLENYDVGEPPEGFAAGINTQSSGGIMCGSGACYGEVFLAAAGPISQTYGIQSGILTVTSTGPKADIFLEDVACSSCSADPGNAIFGQLHLNSAGDATYFGDDGAGSINLGASTVAGNLFVGSGNADINVQDPAGGAVNVTGTTILSAGEANNISIQSPLISGSDITLFAGGNIIQKLNSTTDVHIQTGGNLLMLAASGSISLQDLGHGCSDSGCTADVGNQVAGNVSVVAPEGNAFFDNVPGIRIGLPLSSLDSSSDPSNSSSSLSNAGAAVGGVFDIATPGDITIGSGVSIVAGLGLPSGATDFVLQAGGNFINNSGLGQATLVSANSGVFDIYSQAPTNDVFGGLNSANTAVWDTSYLDSVAASGNRYIFAFQPSITVAAGNLSKAQGTDVSASLVNDFTITGLQSGIAGVYLGDSASNVYSGMPTIVSAGAAAKAATGNYPITISLGGLQVGAGYSVTLASATLSVGAAPPPVLSTSTSTVLTGFVNAIQAPRLPPVINSELAASQFANLIGLPVVPPPPPPPPSPPVDSPLQADNAEQPTSSDQTTSEVANSLDGSSSGARGGRVVIPRILANARPPAPPPTDISALPSFGNSSLWQ
jgi:trimeric autotransporter adhesin